MEDLGDAVKLFAYAKLIEVGIGVFTFIVVLGYLAWLHFTSK